MNENEKQSYDSRLTESFQLREQSPKIKDTKTAVSTCFAENIYSEMKNIAIYFIITLKSAAILSSHQNEQRKNKKTQKILFVLIQLKCSRYSSLYVIGFTYRSVQSVFLI